MQGDVRAFASDELKTAREIAAKTSLHNSRSDWDTEQVKQQGDSYKGLFKCEACKSMKTGFIQVQIDRADEPMTNFVYCYDCKARWKQ